MSITGSSLICPAMTQRLLLIQLRCCAVLSWVLRRSGVLWQLPCATYQEFYDVLLRIEDSDKTPSESKEEEEEKGSNLKKYDKGKGQSSQGPRHTQSFKKSGTSSSSSSEGFNATGQRRGGRLAGGSRFQRPREADGSGGSGAPFCRMCNNRHFGECRRGSSGCYTCGQMGHMSKYCPQNP